MFYGLFHNRQSHAAAFHLIAWFQGLEDLKDALMKFWWDPWAIITDAKFIKVTKVLHRHLHLTIAAIMVFDRIVN